MSAGDWGGREYHGFGEAYNYKMEKRERYYNIIFPIILRMLGKILSGEKGKETEILGKKN